MVTYTLPLDRFPIEVLRYITPAGKRPFNEWIRRLRDARAVSVIDARLEQLRIGSLGDHRLIHDGVWEMRIHIGPGYRIYFVKDSQRLIVLLGGGQKGSQVRDIAKAITYANDYWRRK